MTEPAGASDMLLQPSVIEELLRTLLKALRAYQIYLPNNPIYHKAQAAVQAAFKPIWEVLDELVLVVAETDFTWEEIVVYHQPNKHESLAWTLFKDGMRILTLRKGCEDTEITRLLLVVQRARMLPSDADDDLNTLLWEQQFELITYRFTEFLSDTVPAEFAASLEPQGLGKPGTETHASVMDEVETAKETGGGAAQSESEEGGEAAVKEEDAAVAEGTVESVDACDVSPSSCLTRSCNRRFSSISCA